MVAGAVARCCSGGSCAETFPTNSEGVRYWFEFTNGGAVVLIRRREDGGVPVSLMVVAAKLAVVADSDVVVRTWSETTTLQVGARRDLMEEDGGRRRDGGGGCREGWKERRKIRVRVSCVRWRRWWRGKIWVVNLVSGGLWHVACSGWLILKKWGLPHGMIWLSGV